MSRTPVQHTVDRLRQAAEVEQTPDGVLLDGFVAVRNEAAFAELVRRHGPMVWGVCCRLLSRRQDAEDCYQATFLVLVRKADTVRPRSRIGAWLHGVAYHTALKARHLAAKRGHMEQQVERLPEPNPPTETGADLRQFIDCGLNEVPEKYRLAIVLCDLEGRPIKDVAQELGAPIGTVAGWLTRGRDLLARRLVKHGAPGGAAALTAILAQKAASAPPALALSSASATALALADATIRALFLVNLKSWLIAGAALLMLTLGLGGILYSVLASDPPANPGDQRPDNVRDKIADAKPENTRPLHFGWKAGEAYVYAVRIEVKSDKGTAVYTSFDNYAVAAVAAKNWQRDRGKVIAQAEAGADTSTCLVLQSRFSNTVRNNTSVSQVPFVVGRLALLTVLPDAAEGNATWQATTDCVVADGAPKRAVGTIPRRNADPAGDPAEETSVFTIAKRSGDLLTIDKTYLLKSRQQKDGLPALEFRAEGSIIFDTKGGLTRALDLKGVVREARRPEVPIRVSYQVLEGDERDEAIKTIQASQPREEPPTKAIETPSTGTGNGPEWTDDLAKMQFPVGPAAGRILGQEFKLDAVKLEPGGVLTLRQGHDTLPDVAIIIFLKSGAAIEGKTYEIRTDTPAAQRFPIHLRCTTPGSIVPMAAVFVLNYAMKLEFGKAKDGMIPARIYVCLPDQGKSVVAGSFVLQLP